VIDAERTQTHDRVGKSTLCVDTIMYTSCASYRAPEGLTRYAAPLMLFLIFYLHATTAATSVDSARRPLFEACEENDKRPPVVPFGSSHWELAATIDLVRAHQVIKDLLTAKYHTEAGVDDDLAHRFCRSRHAVLLQPAMNCIRRCWSDRLDVTIRLQRAFGLARRVFGDVPELSPMSIRCYNFYIPSMCVGEGILLIPTMGLADALLSLAVPVDPHTHRRFDGQAAVSLFASAALLGLPDPEGALADAEHAARLSRLAAAHDAGDIVRQRAGFPEGAPPPTAIGTAAATTTTTTATLFSSSSSSSATADVEREQPPLQPPRGLLHLSTTLLARNGFSLYVPDDYHTYASPRPLVVYLHGGLGGTGRTFQYPWLPHARAAGLIVLTPTSDFLSRSWYRLTDHNGTERDHDWLKATDSSEWVTDNEAARPRLLALVADIMARYNIDPERVMLGGHSEGSRAATQIALNHDDARHGPRPWTHLGVMELGASRLPEELLGPIKATLNDPKRRMRVRITHGSQDAFYVVAQTRGFAQQLAEVAPAGAVEWNEHPFWGHGASNDDFEAAARWLVSSPFST
jgi:predicted esterase